ncbi:MAG TPA: lytic murein transglycosylase [Nevskiaceae bacterium]|nr:lytic murein transglycosylase [Nevskiaceae bacterium]
MGTVARWVGVCGLVFSCGAWAGFSQAPGVPALLTQLREQDHFTAPQIATVEQALAAAQFLSSLIPVPHPAPARPFPWARYRRIAVNPRNLRHGLEFLQAQHYWLAKAERIYGVPPAVIAAILGVESHYGRNAGHLRTLDVLATLAFDDPARHAFFFSQLRQFFVLCRNERFDPAQVTGSYAGAIGDAQFMPGNYLKFGVDFDADGSVNLWSVPDAIGSIANYLAHFDPRRAWQRGMPLIRPAQAPAQIPQNVVVNSLYPTTTIAGLSAAGIGPAEELALPGRLRAGYVHLTGAGGWPANWLVLPNFYSVMAYNPSTYYAMGVAQLAHALVAEQSDSGG